MEIIVIPKVMVPTLCVMFLTPLIFQLLFLALHHLHTNIANNDGENNLWYIIRYIFPYLYRQTIVTQNLGYRTCHNLPYSCTADQDKCPRKIPSASVLPDYMQNLPFPCMEGILHTVELCHQHGSLFHKSHIHFTCSRQ